MTSKQRWYLLLNYFSNKIDFLFICEIRFWSLRFRQFDIMSSKYSTKQHVTAQYCDKQMSEIWCKNIQAFLRYSNFRAGIFILPHPVYVHIFLPANKMMMMTMTMMLLLLMMMMTTTMMIFRLKTRIPPLRKEASPPLVRLWCHTTGVMKDKKQRSMIVNNRFRPSQSVDNSWQHLQWRRSRSVDNSWQHLQWRRSRSVDNSCSLTPSRTGSHINIGAYFYFIPEYLL